MPDLICTLLAPNKGFFSDMREKTMTKWLTDRHRTVKLTRLEDKKETRLTHVEAGQNMNKTDSS